MKRMIRTGVISIAVMGLLGGVQTSALAAEGDSISILKQGLLGAATGAISAEVSGGKAGKGALIGAGTNVIGGALLNFLSGSPQTAYPAGRSTAAVYSQPVYYQSAPRTVYVPEPVYARAPSPAYPAYSAYEDPNKTILKQGLLGAGVGAISAGASGGKAGTGALVGAGTNVIGGAILDTLTSPSGSPVPSYTPPYSAASPAAAGAPVLKKIIRHYDEEGRLVTEEEIWG